MIPRYAVAIAGEDHCRLVDHLRRDDGQEDLCFALWRPSTGDRRTTALVREAILPGDGERHVHGNASFESSYAVRAARIAASQGAGLAFLHAHPAGGGWQALSNADRRAEVSIANLAHEFTGQPLLGLTLGGAHGSWSARMWDQGHGRDRAPTWCESVRIVGDRLLLTFNDELRPVPAVQATQVRTVHSWGAEVQANLSRLRVLVVGVGSVGLLILERLARTGIEHLGAMDFDGVEFVNLDRLHGATRLDARLYRSKTHVARRILGQAATAARPLLEAWEYSVCEPAGLVRLLDFDVVFSCVDRPWPRHVLNTVAHADLVPVIDGGLRLEPAPHGGLRNAYWRAHVIGPGRPCLACLGQYNPGDVQAERDGSLDDPSYIAGLPSSGPIRANQNVAALAVAAASAQLNQFLSLVVAPSGLGDPGPQRFSLANHRIEIVDGKCETGCEYRASRSDGDGRLSPTFRHLAAERARASRAAASRRPSVRAYRMVDDLLATSQRRLGHLLAARSVHVDR
jgi:molybdopterin-synthase adenylyltransferase